VDLGRILFFENADALAIDSDTVFRVTDVRFEISENGIVLQQMRKRLRIRDVIHGNDVDSFIPDRRSIYIPSDTSEPINPNLYSHVPPLEPVTRKYTLQFGMIRTYTLALRLGLFVLSPFFLIRSRKYWPTLSDRFGYLKLPELHDSVW